jgi:hypothetical protein
MRRFLVGSVTMLALTLSTVVPADAGGLGGKTSLKSSCLVSKTVTTSVYTATLNPNEPETGSGTATYTYTTVAITILGCTFTSSCATLTVTASGLSDPDNTVVVFELNEDENNPLGSAFVTGGAVSLTLSTKNGQTVPNIGTGDTIEIDLANIEFDLLEGTFGDPVTTVTTCGCSR